MVKSATEARLLQWSSDLGLWLRTSALPLWWTLGADHERGGFYDALDLSGAPVMRPKRARVQARQIYVFALATTIGWTGPGSAATAHGHDFFQRHYHRSNLGFCKAVSVNGDGASEDFMLYEQAFALFCLAWAKRAGIRGSFEDDAIRLLGDVIRPRAGSAGGFREGALDYPWQSNPHMHLLEAFLAWEQVSDSPIWRREADKVVSLALNHFVDDFGAVREYFTESWQPAAGANGSLLEPGHQFEWAWLLERWARSRGRADASAAAHRLFEIGSQYGIDRDREVAVNAVSSDLFVIDANARLWPQTERLKAALIFAESAAGEARERRLGEAVAAATALSKYLQTAVPGLWRDVMLPDGSFADEPAPASSLYHIACAIIELENWAGRARSTV